MVYLQTFQLPTREQEENFFFGFHRTCYTNFYPFGVFRTRPLPPLTFEPVTILYGGNGSGKSTVLNVIAASLGIAHRSAYTRSSFFADYLGLCCHTMAPRCSAGVLENSRILTSDDVFDYLLDMRCLNEKIDRKRDELLAEYTQLKYAKFRMRSLDDYDAMKRHAAAGRSSGSGFVKQNLMENTPLQSNGQSALAFFTQAIRENALYLLDEPENSLSVTGQQELQEFLWQSARFFGCQFIIATHSPLLLAMPQAKIYDLDAQPIRSRKWTELENVRAYREFFQLHEAEF